MHGRKKPQFNSIKIFNAQTINKIDQPSVAWEVIPGLGRTGKGSVGMLPATAPAMTSVENNQLMHQAPRLEYDINFPQAGEFSLQFYLIPTHPLAGNELRFAVGLNDSEPQLVALDVKDGSAEWAQGVLSATRVITAPIKVTKVGRHKLKIYGVDAGVLLDKIVVDIDGVPDSYLGLSATH